jgi:hypothetical protein
VPQAPQCCALVRGSTHAPPHAVCPAVHCTSLPASMPLPTTELLVQPAASTDAAKTAARTRENKDLCLIINLSPVKDRR